MLRHLKNTFVALLVAGAVHSAHAFSLLGPFSAWQIREIGYDIFDGNDIGAPKNLGEEYRWNIKTITYGFDESFLNYFGQQGVDAVNQAFAILNALPATSQMSSNLTEFPLDTRRSNYRASALGLYDLKSAALGLLTEEIGLASPERYAWTLRSRRVVNNVPYYTVIKRNFDPVTWAPSSYVNGVLYTYGIVQLVANPPRFDALEVQVDPLAFGYTAVASDWDGLVSTGAGGISGPGLGAGEFYTGLTRDDAGSLRYLYRPNNYNVEDVIPGTTGGSFFSGGGGSPFTPAGGGNGGGVGGTNNLVGVSPRPGVDHLTFQRGQYDSLIGNFITVTNQYSDTYVTNGSLATQTTERVLNQPDILITAQDLDVDPTFGIPIFVRRELIAPPAWVNNDGLNGQAVLDGPGVINGPIRILFSKIGPFIFNSGPVGGSFLDEFNFLFIGPVWGSYDGTTNEPVVYPIGTSILELEQQVLGGN